ncbi:MAG: SEC-C domain-containing protein [Planctomycetes bacterium]|nr:SEC-C domain-containing protein [Planctomycetota bacterium]
MLHARGRACQLPRHGRWHPPTHPDLNMTPRSSRPGRNDPCVCGSGLKFKRCHGGPQAPIESAPATGLGRVSEALLRVAEPLFDDGQVTVAEYSHRLKIASLAWNLAVLEAEAADTTSIREQMIRTGLNVMDFIDWIAQRKRDLYPDDNRTILSTEVIGLPNGDHHVQVVFSTSGTPTDLDPQVQGPQSKGDPVSERAEGAS